MLVEGQYYRTIWFDEAEDAVAIIDQTLLPHEFKIIHLRTLDDAAYAISSMQVRGAPLIGAATAYGFALGVKENPAQEAETDIKAQLLATRPTAVNLRWALDRMAERMQSVPEEQRIQQAFIEAQLIADEGSQECESIGEHGAKILQEIYDKKSNDEPLNILTHCNAGWLAMVDWGTALSPIYKAHEAGIPIHVWVDETRPRNQGASLTAWELGQQGISHTVIVDNAGGHLMQHGMVDLCIVGSDRTTSCGDVCNKIGTYLKALSAFDNDVPFYVALPVSTIDWEICDGVKDIPIEQRNSSEVKCIQGIDEQGKVISVRLTPEDTPAANYAFDVTPARLVTALITEHGVYPATKEGLLPIKPA